MLKSAAEYLPPGRVLEIFRDMPCDLSDDGPPDSAEVAWEEEWRESVRRKFSTAQPPPSGSQPPE